ncbi:MAG: AlbA family DNA-binding domain-containing protein [Candidatus Hodarchaeales archaeon]
MKDCNELLDLLEQKELETTKIEFKRSPILKNPKDLAFGLVALANRYGGKLVIGITDEGEFEGKEIFKVDKAKGIIDNICNDRCSPPIEYSIDCLECVKGDVLIVNVERRKDVPHAYTRRSNGEIMSRTYYIRTSHGKRLVTDKQLDWMFRSVSDPGFYTTFTFQMSYDVDTLQPIILEDLPWQNYFTDPLFLNIFQKFTGEDAKYAHKEPINYIQLFLEIMPILTLGKLAMDYSIHWNVSYDQRGEMLRIHIITDLPKTEYSIQDIIHLSDNTILNQTSVNLDNAFQNALQTICVPKDVEIKLIRNEKDHPALTTTGLKIYKDNEFQLDIRFNYLMWRYGFPSHHPINAITKKDRMEEQRQIATITIQTDIKSSINLYDYNITNLDEIRNWMLNISNSLENHLSWEKYAAKIPSPMLFRIDHNVKKIVKKLS